MANKSMGVGPYALTESIRSRQISVGAEINVYDKGSFYIQSDETLLATKYPSSAISIQKAIPHGYEWTTKV